MSTTRVWIHGEERYPDYLIDEPAHAQSSEWEKTYRDRQTYEVPEDVFARWVAATEAYNLAQDEIRDFVKSHWSGTERIK